MTCTRNSSGPKEVCSTYPGTEICQTGHQLLNKRSLFQGGQVGKAHPTGNFISLLSSCHHLLLLNMKSATDVRQMTKRDYDSALEKCASDNCHRIILGAGETLATDCPAWPQQVCQGASLWAIKEGAGTRERPRMLWAARSSLQPKPHLLSHARLNRSGCFWASVNNSAPLGINRNRHPQSWPNPEVRDGWHRTRKDTWQPLLAGLLEALWMLRHGRAIFFKETFIHWLTFQNNKSFKD